MKVDEGELCALHYDVTTTLRPDGSVLLTVACNGRSLERIIDESSSPSEVVRQIKLDMALDASHPQAGDAIKYCSARDLPTYSREPLYRTRSASLWNLRKIRPL